MRKAENREKWKFLWEVIDQLVAWIMSIIIIIIIKAFFEAKIYLKENKQPR